MVFDASKKTFDGLRSSLSNYTSWKLNIEAGHQTEPEYVDADAPTAAEISAHDDWEDLWDQAAGMLWLCIKPDQKEHVKNVRNDPVCMWDTLEDLQQAKNSCPFLTHVTKLGSKWRELLPTTLPLNQLAKELQCVTAVCGISDSHETVTTNLLQNNVDKLMIDAVRTAFYTKDNRPVIGGSSTTVPCLAFIFLVQIGRRTLRLLQPRWSYGSQLFLEAEHSKKGKGEDRC
ncbi:hypothetical protein C8R45DRAFT_1109963 [Mycena sanguinolenta]|nr:hypothetical protein C8R45DRAFT_1109963 [Mycena sanguinolenta]